MRLMDPDFEAFLVLKKRLFVLTLHVVDMFESLKLESLESVSSRENHHRLGSNLLYVGLTRCSLTALHY